jgi:hypothetical protein
MKRLLAFAIVIGLVFPAGAAAHHHVMKPGSRFWVLSSRPPQNSEIGNRFNSYKLCRHGISGDPATGPVFTTPGGFPLRLTGFEPRAPQGSGVWRYAYSKDRWSTRLLIIHAPHQPPVWTTRAVNPKGSKKAVFYWRCRHPKH